MKNAKTIIFVLLITLFIGGCTGSVSPNEGEEIEEVIEDEELKNEVWKSVLFDSITSIGNAESFDSPEEVEVAELANFAYLKTVREEGLNSLEKDEENRYIIQNDKIEEVAKTYFDLENIDFSSVNHRTYLEDEKGFAFHFTPEEIPNYDDSNPWSIYFDRLTLYEDNLYKARLVSYFGSEKKYVRTEWVYGLRKDNSNWTIESMEKNYPDNGLVKVEGPVELIPKIIDFPKQLRGENNLRILTTTNDKLIVTSHIEIDDDYTNILAIIDIGTMSMTNQIDVGKNVYGFKIKEGSIIVKLKKKVVAYDHQLNVVNEIDIPEEIYSLEDREVLYDESYNALTWYSGYDINDEFTSICYADEEGLKLFYYEDSQSYMRIQTPHFPNSSRASFGYFSDPKFVAGDSKILMAMLGYESVRDYLVHDLSGIYPTYELEVGKYSLILHDINGQELAGISRNEGVQISLKDIEVEDLEAQWPLKGEHEMQHKFVFNSSDKFAFTLKDYDNDETLIYSVNTVNNSISGPLATVEKGNVNIIGILDDGSIFCSYSYYLNEHGYFIINTTD